MDAEHEYVPGEDEVGPGPGRDREHAAEGDDRILARCEESRDEMPAHETAECAGESLRERYEQEEDGGS